jgi:hypothetical protein
MGRGNLLEGVLGKVTTLNHPLEEGPEAIIIVLHRNWPDRAFEMFLPKSTAGLFVAVDEVAEELSDFFCSTFRVGAVLQKPQEVPDEKAAALESAGCIKAHFAFL